MRWLRITVAIGCGLSLGQACTQPAADDCAPGSEGCPCTSGGECDGELQCLSDLCVDANGTSDGSASAGSMSSTTAGTTAGTSMGTSVGTTTSADASSDPTIATTDEPTTTDMTTADTGESSSDDASTGVGGTIEFHGNFLHNVDAAGECAEWNDFRSQLVGHTFTKITMSGSEDPVGRSCEGPGADTICQAIFAGSPTTVGCDGGFGWSISDDCFGGLELDADSTICSCGSSFAVRPCSDTNYWGGLNTDTCDTPSQSIDIVCEY